MEAELQKFRQRKLANEKKEKIKESLKKSWDNVTSKLAAAVLPEREGGSEEEEDGEELEEGPSSSSSVRRHHLKGSKKSSKLASSGDVVDEGDDSGGRTRKKQSRTLAIAVIMLKLLMWIFLWVGFIKIGFGAVFFAISALYFIWANMDSGRRKRKGEKSAYSVFNENCEAIEGTLDAKILEKHLLYRGAPGD